MQSLPTTMWSSTRTSISSNADFNLFVMRLSACEGVESPDGWLCEKITAEGFFSSTSFTTSRG